MFDRILLAVDHSGHSAEATRLTAHLARAFSSQVHVLHVLEAPVAAVVGRRPVAGVETEVDARALVGRQLTLLRDRGIAADGAVDESGGILVDTIVATGRRMDAGLIALGTVGGGTLNPLGIGSVAHGVVSHADRPVLAVRQSHRLEPGRLLPMITAGVDGSPESLRAVAIAAELARRLAAELQLVHVRDRSTSGFDPDQLLPELAARAGALGVRTSVEIAADGDAAGGIDAAASRHAGGLVVVGRRGHGASEVIGGVAHRLLRTTWLPVLVVAGHTPVPDLRPA